MTALHILDIRAQASAQVGRFLPLFAVAAVLDAIRPVLVAGVVRPVWVVPFFPGLVVGIIVAEAQS